MTQSEWMESADPYAMVWELRQVEPSNRKLVLVTVEHCRRIPFTMEHEPDQVALNWADQVIEDWKRAETIDEPEIGDCYLMSTLANRCYAAAESAMRGKSEDVFNFILEYIEVAKDQSHDIGPYGLIEELLRDIFGNPFRPVRVDPSWLTPTVTALAQTIYDHRRFEDMPILADALEEAGCTNEDILQHCRGGGVHARGCWVVDLLLRKG